jgi:hypothetical protein
LIQFCSSKSKRVTYLIEQIKVHGNWKFTIQDSVYNIARIILNSCHLENCISLENTKYYIFL